MVEAFLLEPMVHHQMEVEASLLAQEEVHQGQEVNYLEPVVHNSLELLIHQRHPNPSLKLTSLLLWKQLSSLCND